MKETGSKIHTHTLPALFLSLNTRRSTLPLPGQSEESGALNSACGGVGGGALGSPLSLQHSLPLIWAPCPPACPAPRLRAALLSPIVVRLRQWLPYTFSLDPRCLSSNLRHKPHLPMPEPILSVLLPTTHLPGVSAATFLSQWRSGEVRDSGCHGWACPQGREWHRQTHSCPCHPGTCTQSKLGLEMKHQGERLGLAARGRSQRGCDLARMPVARDHVSSGRTQPGPAPTPSPSPSLPLAPTPEGLTYTPLPSFNSSHSLSPVGCETCSLKLGGLGMGTGGAQGEKAPLREVGMTEPVPGQTGMPLH